MDDFNATPSHQSSATPSSPSELMANSRLSPFWGDLACGLDFQVRKISYIPCRTAVHKRTRSERNDVHLISGAPDDLEPHNVFVNYAALFRRSLLRVHVVTVEYKALLRDVDVETRGNITLQAFANRDVTVNMQRSLVVGLQVVHVHNNLATMLLVTTMRRRSARKSAATMDAER